MKEPTVDLVDSGRRITCKEAAQLLRENKVTKVWFRPDYVINYLDPGSDLAIVWMKDRNQLTEEALKRGDNHIFFGDENAPG